MSVLALKGPGCPGPCTSQKQSDHTLYFKSSDKLTNFLCGEKIGGHRVIYLFYILGGLLIVQGVFSLIEGLRFYNFIRRSIQKPPADFTPKASIIAPYKGIDPALEENLRGLFKQDYPDYEIIFAIASDMDPSRPAIERAMRDYPDKNSELIIAGHSEGRGEKVNNMLAALDHISLDSEALVFVDSDASVQPFWLRSLVSGLKDGQAGAATGYRWYLPESGGFWSALLSAWNGSVATTLGDHKGNFAWGGSTAIPRESFERFGVASRWERAVSDDYALTRAVHDAGSYVKFVPACLTITREDATLKSLLEFTTRQIIITRVYRPKVWWVGMVSHFLFSATFWGGIALILIRSAGGKSLVLPLMMISLIYLLGSLKGTLRMAGAMEALSETRREILKLWWMYCLLWPLAGLVFLYNFILSATTRRITWRGITYEMRSPTETIIVKGKSKK